MPKIGARKPMTYKTDSGVALIRIECPPQIFDVEGAYIMRRKRVAIHKLDAIKRLKAGQEDEMYGIFADLVPMWSGVLDVEDGSELPNLSDEPSGLSKLDSEQLGWLTSILQASPSIGSADPKFGTAVPTS